MEFPGIRLFLKMWIDMEGYVMKRGLPFFLLLFLLFFVHSANAQSVYVMTLTDISIEEAQDGVRDFMFAKNFSLDAEFPHTLIFSKRFPQLFGTHRRAVRFNFQLRENGTRVLISGAINQLGPILKEMRHQIDSTPRHQIRNEAINQMPGFLNKSPLILGIVIRHKNRDGFAVINEVRELSWALDVGLKPNDLILEIDGNPTTQNSIPWIRSLLAGLYEGNTSFTLKIERDGRKGIVRFVPIYAYRPIRLPSNNPR